MSKTASLIQLCLGATPRVDARNMSVVKSELICASPFCTPGNNGKSARVFGGSDADSRTHLAKMPARQLRG